MAAPPGWPYPPELVQQAVDQYGTPQHFAETGQFADHDALRRLQDVRLREEVSRASRIPFYRRLWDKGGFDPRTFRGRQDLHRIPQYTIEDIRESLTLAPPYGDYQGVVPGPGVPGTRLYFSGGTTGTPRPTVYTAWDRIVGALLGARTMYMHGARPGDVVVNAWAYSTHNGAWAVDESVWLWLGVTPITTSTGNMTSSIKQLELARDYGAASILASADHLLHLRKVAEEAGMRREDFDLQWFSTIGDTAAVSDAWGTPTAEFYAFHEVQVVSYQCSPESGMHVFEDAMVVEVVDVETGEPVPPGEPGDVVVTCLYKTGSPQIRYNIKDLSRLLPGTCACGNPSMRMGKLEGRSDTMIKLRGINIWPEAIGSVLNDELGHDVDYFCVAYRRGDRDQMVTLVERPAAVGADAPAVQERLASAINARLGPKVGVRLVDPRALDPLTGRGQVTKLRRFRDVRKSDQPDSDVAPFLPTEN